MKVKYVDINTGEVKKAEFWENIPELGQYRLKLDDGTFLVICQWQKRW